jgi:hypothetical protein
MSARDVPLTISLSLSLHSSMVQLGAPQGEIVLPPPTPTEPYPPFPVEVDDQYILPHQILGQPEGSVSLLTGFNHGIKIYMTMNGLVSIELSYGITTLPWSDQRTMLEECLHAVKRVMDVLPGELFLDLHQLLALGTDGFGSASTPIVSDVFADAPGFQYHPPAFPAAQPPTDIRHLMQTQPLRRLLLQYEIQKANIYSSQLATRSYFVERYLNLRDNHRAHARAQAAAAVAAAGYTDDGSGNSSNRAVAAAAVQAAAEQQHHHQGELTDDVVDVTMMAEREQIVMDLVAVLGAISQRGMEPNGGSLINKVRQVASTLVGASPDRKGPMALKADEYLARFVEVLMRLERTGPAAMGSSASSGTDDLRRQQQQQEEEELRSWADLRDYHMKFAQNGGFMASL